MKRLIVLIQTLIMTATLGLAQNASPKVAAFNGVLTDLTGKPVKRAHVWVRSERDYALTDGKGRFGLTNVQTSDTLHVSIKKQQFCIPIAGRKSLRIKLADVTVSEVEEDQQLVDIGFGYVSRREHTGVSNYISGDELRRSGQHDIISALQGRIAGLNITGTGGIGGGGQEVSMRGTRTILGNSTPIFLIDGVVVPSFEGLNLNDVNYVEIMKDASIYGSNGGNGAIIVHTKTEVSTDHPNN